jgi:dsRNA-specific ribonuclease
MTLTRHATVDNDISLVAASEALDIMKHTKHQIDTNNHTLNRGSPMYRKFAADVFEALVGAIYLDQGGFYATKHRVYDIFGAFIQK